MKNAGKLLAAMLIAATLVAAVLVTGCAKSSAGAGNVIKIGVFEPMTGANAAGGAMEVEGVKLANEMYPTVTVGGKEYKVELVIADNKSDKVEAANAAQRLVDKDKVSVMLGSWGSSLSMAAGPIVPRRKGSRDWPFLHQSARYPRQRLLFPRVLHRPLPGNRHGELRV